MKQRKAVIQTVLLSILINGVVPIIVYNLLLPHFASVTALMIATAIPLADNVIYISKHRKIDVFALFMLAGFILSIIAFFIGGNERLILLRESFVTGLLGLGFILSLLLSRPLIYHFALKFIAGDDSAKQNQFHEGWNLPYFRFVMRMMTGVWGIALLGEAVIKISLVYQLSVSAFLAISQIITYAIIGITILWTIWYRKYANRKIEWIKN